MKVAVLGGYGVFGSRLAELLIRDGHEVVVAGRNAGAAKALADKIGAFALHLDRGGDLGPLWALSPDVVVDAAGPFHAYGNDPYRLARAAIAQGVTYLDLADDADFCAGIATLDAAAKAAGVVVLSGMSSVPALSSAAVAALAHDADEVASIESAILPGNRAPRGQAIVDSILYQAGTDIDVTVDGISDPVRSWSRARIFALPEGVRRRGYMIRVPDQSLFPAFFQARSVTFHAGLEVAVMNHGLAAFSWLRGKLGFGIAPWFSRCVRLGADLLHGLGSDVGGMVVKVVLRKGDTWEARTWGLLVRKGEGPYIPAISARTVLRDLGKITPGARAGLAVFPLADAVAAMDDLAAVTDISTQVQTPLFPATLGTGFADLPAVVQASHQTFAPRRLVGMANIARGPGRWPRLLAKTFGFPAAARDMPVTVIKTPQDGSETWERRFGANSFQSHLSQGPRGMVEAFGPFRFDLDLHVADGALHFPVRAGRVFGIPLPAVFLPISEAREIEKGGVFHFDVALKAPITRQLIVHYQGYLHPVEQTKPKEISAEVC